MKPEPICGSYAPEDCRFLLQPIRSLDIPVPEKERLIQSGQRHYSEMLTQEHPLSASYRKLFHQLTQANRRRLAQDILNLADHIRTTRPAPITVVSLARAGTPIGALVQRALRRFGVDSQHYSISIIRDRGIDEQALAYILRQAQRPPEGLLFVDGWTAKGVITLEFRQAIAAWNRKHPEQLTDTLYVVSDIGGVADIAASQDDYVIPCGILGAVVSGLVSRSILNEQIGPEDFHGCVVYDHLRNDDLSNWFLNFIEGAMNELTPQALPPLDATIRRHQTKRYLDWVQQEFRIRDINQIKPGVLEASRVMLRRLPGLLLLRDPDCTDVTHLRLLAEEKGVPMEYDPGMPFNATALIKDLRLLD